MAPRKTAAPKAPRAPKAPKAPKSSTAQKPLTTGDVSPHPQHTFRADMGEGLPPQADTLNPKRAQ